MSNSYSGRRGALLSKLLRIDEFLDQAARSKLASLVS
jgi:hypothetical protein